MESINAVTWKEDLETGADDTAGDVIFDDEDFDALDVDFGDDDSQDGWEQVEEDGGGAQDITIDNLFSDTEEDSASSIYIDKKLQVIVMPVQLKTKTVNVYLTQDSEYCKLYLTDVLGSLPKDVSMMVGDMVWVLPRAYPIQNTRLLNKLYFKAQQANTGQKDMVEVLSIRDIMAAATNDTSELNYINSQLTLVDMTEESEFGGYV